MTTKAEARHHAKIARGHANYLWKQGRKHTAESSKSNSKTTSTQIKNSATPEISIAKKSLAAAMQIFVFMARTLEPEKFVQYANAVSKILFSMLLVTLPASAQARAAETVYNFMRVAGNATEYLEFGCNSVKFHDCPDSNAMAEAAKNIGATIVSSALNASTLFHDCHLFNSGGGFFARSQNPDTNHDLYILGTDGASQFADDLYNALSSIFTKCENSELNSGIDFAIGLGVACVALYASLYACGVGLAYVVYKGLPCAGFFAGATAVKPSEEEQAVLKDAEIGSASRLRTYSGSHE